MCSHSQYFTIYPVIMFSEEFISCMQQPNIPLMKTPQNSMYNVMSASSTQPDYSSESEIRTH